MAQRADSENIIRKTFFGGDCKEDQLLPALRYSISRAKSIDLCVAFLMESGARALVKDLEAAQARNTPIRILCGNYLAITQPAALFLLKKRLPKAQIRFYDDPNRSFHPKSYMFRLEDREEIYIGSSNMSWSALGSGIEWNYRLSSKTDPASVKEFKAAFEDLYNNHAYDLSEEKLKSYSASWRRPQVYKDLEHAKQHQDQKTRCLSGSSDAGSDSELPFDFVPRGPQIEALAALEETRSQGADKALVQAATGVGKTYLAAFDSREYKRVLFVAHRQEILHQAARTFQNVRPESSIGFFSQEEKNTDADLIFASVQTLGKEKYLFEYFSPKDFDYIVIDEFHHAVTDCYARIVRYFRPKFLLGLTATPERMDGRNIYEICDYNVPYEIDLFKAINQGVLVPFHYYGIYDDTDYSKLDYRQGRYPAEVLNKAYLQNQRRYDLIFKHYKKYPSRRALGFCSTREHAASMARDFIQRGIKSAALVSGLEDDVCLDRKTALEKLENEEIQVLFSVDMLNEGVDIPDLDMVMFLRPTESPVVFLQQLGRGLRKYPGKEYLNVLDFLGNYRNVARVPGYLGRNRNISSADNRNISDSQMCYPQDCLVDFDFRLIDLFEHLNRKNTSIQDRIEQEYIRIKEELGHVPTRMDLFTYMDDGVYELAVQNARFNPFRDYLSYRQNQGDLSTDLLSMLHTPARSFLNLLETTNMSKVYKMPVLKAFLGNPGEPVRSRLSKEELLESWKAFFSSAGNWKDLPQGKSYEAYINISDRAHLSNILKNPVNFLIKSGNGFFEKTEDAPIALNPSLDPWLASPAFKAEMEDIIDYRTNHYYQSRYKSQKT